MHQISFGAVPEIIPGWRENLSCSVHFSQNCPKMLYPHSRDQSFPQPRQNPNWKECFIDHTTKQYFPCRTVLIKSLPVIKHATWWSAGCLERQLSCYTSWSQGSCSGNEGFWCNPTVSASQYQPHKCPSLTLLHTQNKHKIISHSLESPGLPNPSSYVSILVPLV